MRPDLAWGFQVGVGYECDCSYGEVSYRLLFRYQNVDLRWGQHVTERCGRTLNLFGNVRWVDLQRKSQARGVTTAGGVGLWDQHSRFTGAALGVGASADVSIWRCFSFAGMVNGMAAIGERKVTPTADLSQFLPMTDLSNSLERARSSLPSTFA